MNKGVAPGPGPGAPAGGVALGFGGLPGEPRAGLPLGGADVVGAGVEQAGVVPAARLSFGGGGRREMRTA